MAETYYVNTTLEIEAKVKRRNGQPFNPGGVRVDVTDPDEEVTTFIWGIDDELYQPLNAQNNPIIGTFILAFTPTKPGQYKHVFSTTGDFLSTTKGIFEVEEV